MSDAKQNFFDYASTLTTNPKILKMKDNHHHKKNITCLDHSLFVSYTAYLICNKIGGDKKAVIKAGILHDLYLYDRRARDTHKIGFWMHMLCHPNRAIKNAKEFNLTELEKHIIKNHMWPVTLKSIPKRKEAIIVNIADKICAFAEVTGIYYLLINKLGLKTLTCN